MVNVLKQIANSAELTLKAVQVACQTSTYLKKIVKPRNQTTPFANRNKAINIMNVRDVHNRIA